jgi:hypothetical protein
MSRSKSNVPAAALRWRVERAGVEFGCSSNTLRKSLAKNSAAADQDGLFTTQQIIAALYGALHQEKLRTQRQIADRITLENQITRGELLNRAALSKAFAQIADAISSRIMWCSELPRVAREDILRELSGWPLALEEVAARQSRLPRGNGMRPESEGEER